MPTGVHVSRLASQALLPATMADIPVISLPNSPGWSRWIERLRAATAGRFTIVRELGRGGFAAVFLAQQQQPNRRVAIKLLLPAHLDSAWALDHFRGESQKISEWRHQSVVTIYEVHEVEDLFFFVMSYVEGGSLHDLIAKLGPLSVPITRSVLAQVGGALQYAHRQGVTHRDIKPHNVLIDVDGGAVVTDFGIAKQSGGTSHTVTGMIFGTAPYMAPEQCETGATSIMSDQYALGIVAFEMMTGTPPFTGAATSVLMAHLQKQAPLLSTVRPDCPPELEAAVARMLSKNPADRFANIAEAMQAAGAAELPEYSPDRRRFAQAARDIAARAEAHVIDIVSIPPTLEVGDRIPLHASAKTSAGEPVAASQIVWSSDNTEVAALDANNGELTALTPGFTTLFVRSGGGEQQVRVDVKPPQAAWIQVSGPRKPLHVGETSQLAATARSKHGLPVSGAPVWVSEDPKLVAITSDGVLQALAVGRTRVFAQVDQVSSEFWIDVAPAAVAELRIVGAPSRLTMGDRRQLSAVVLDTADHVLTDRVVQWSSSDRKLATVSPTGLITASSAGVVTISASCEVHSASIRFTVEELQAVMVEIANAPGTLRVGESVRVRAVARDGQGNAIDRPIGWITDDQDVARVSADGTLSAVAPGTVVVAASMDGVTRAVVVEITARPVIATAPPVVPPLAATAVFGTAAAPAQVAAKVVPPVTPPVIPATPTVIPPVIPSARSIVERPVERSVDIPVERPLVKAIAVEVIHPAPPSARSDETVMMPPPLRPPATPPGGPPQSVSAGKLPMRWIGIGAVAVLAVVAVIVLKPGGASDAGGVGEPVPDTLTAARPPVLAPPTNPTDSTEGVTPPPTPPAKPSLRLSGAPKIMTVGETHPLEAAGDRATLSALKWKSSNTQMAAVNARGVIRALRPGRVLITASAGDLDESVSIEVQAAKIGPTPVDSAGIRAARDSFARAARESTAQASRDSALRAGRDVAARDAAARDAAAREAAAREASAREAAARERLARDATGEAAADSATVRKLVLDYAAALSAENLPAAVQLFPGMLPNVRAGYQDMFKQRTDLNIRYSVSALDLQKNTGTLTLSNVTDLTFATKAKCRILFTDVMGVERAGSGWRISTLSTKQNSKSGC